MGNADNFEGSDIQAKGNSIAIGGISVGGNVGDIRIGHTIGYTSEQVSVLLAQISNTFQPKPFDGRSPYKGLDVFDEEDAELFFGREKLVDDLVGRVARMPLKQTVRRLEQIHFHSKLPADMILKKPLQTI